MKVAIVHDWLTGMRGGEKCLEVFCEIFPEADLFTLLHVDDSVSKTIEDHCIRTSFLQSMPGIKKRYRYYLPLMPSAIHMIDLSGYDFILSSSHCVAKGAKGDKRAFHLCYCYTPMRYAWTAYEDYFGGGRVSGLSRLLIPRAMKYLRNWDMKANKGIHEFVAISYTVADRIRRFYRREADVLYPPVDTNLYQPQGEVEDYYLVVSAFAPYKRVDVAVEAFNRLGRPLRVVGDGQDFERVRKLGKSNIEFLGWQDSAELAKLYAGCRAFIFPGEEDFGITPLEAQACGRPVIALGVGGTLETVVALNREEFQPPPGIARWDDMETSDIGPTGLYFDRSEVDCLVKAVKRFEREETLFQPGEARRQAGRFDRGRFKQKARHRFLAGWERHLQRVGSPGNY